MRIFPIATRDDRALNITDQPRARTRTPALPTRYPDLESAATSSAEETLGRWSDGLFGIDMARVAELVDQYGRNEVVHDRRTHPVLKFLKAFTNPFNLILLFLVAVLLCTDVILADDGPDYTAVITISTMVVVSAALRFWQEHRSEVAADRLAAMVRTTTAVTRRRDGRPVTAELPIEDVVPGDVVELAAGDMIPADVRFVRVKDLQVNQAMITGESLPAEKTVASVDADDLGDVLDAPNLGFMGTTVVSGSATAVVIGTGARSYFGGMSSSIVNARTETAFDVGIKKVSRTLITFMLLMVPAVFIINGLTKDWGSAFLFAVTTAVGLTPEMLPLIVTANLAKGARVMAKEKVVVKRLNSIQNLGAMDVLATDKTGTLTEDRIVLERHLDTHGANSELALTYGAINAHFQTGLRNLLDEAVLRAADEAKLADIRSDTILVDEMPFDFERRRMSVVVTTGTSHLIITKGAVEEVMRACVREGAPSGGAAITAQRTAAIEQLVAEQNGQGMRVLAVAVKEIPFGDEDLRDAYTTADESDMTLVGFLSFLDPPKQSAAAAIRSLTGHGVAVKVITGDNPLVAAKVCGDVGIDVGEIVLGSQLDALSDAELTELARETTVFAKVNPAQKARIVTAMRDGGSTVGFLGDGINDAPALRAADVGISVDTAVDIAKESADIILLEKDLTVLERGVMEGRRTFVNTMKYIKMTASSNFGNMFSVLVASALLPFLPMIPVIALIQNLTYDLAMLTLPWDRVDEKEVRGPRRWESESLSKFMIRIGPISSIFDVTTYALMWFVFAANAPEHAALFQSGWFIESIISQTIIVHLLRTRRIPFVQSRASIPVLLATGAVCVFGLVLPFTGFGAGLGLVPLPWTYFPWLVATLVAYVALTEFAKRVFIRRHGVWI